MSNSTLITRSTRLPEPQGGRRKANKSSDQDGRRRSILWRGKACISVFTEHGLWFTSLLQAVTKKGASEKCETITERCSEVMEDVMSWSGTQLYCCGDEQVGSKALL
ncbi:unnamed protein product [Brassica napus]|uniref:(rape) hypothetical protein n=1 Tax=Brassica napus TaxID=3708 RepID=A0A816WSV2_BRANA|nr:unnamed protein product [Brassica napus]